MDANPYAPPTAEVADYAPRSSDQEVDTPFFSVSLPKLAILGLCTLSLYEIYWFYKNWKLIRAREGSNIMPALRAFFAVFFCYSCFARIRDHGVKVGARSELGASGLAALWIVLGLLWRLPDPYWWISMLSVVPLLFVQAYANQVNELAVPGHDRNAKFSWLNWIAIVLGGAFLLLAFVGTFFPQR